MAPDASSQSATGITTAQARALAMAIKAVKEAAERENAALRERVKALEDALLCVWDWEVNSDVMPNTEFGKTLLVTKGLTKERTIWRELLGPLLRERLVSPCPQR